MNIDDGIMLQMQEDGTWGTKKEPYCTVEFPAKEDYEKLQEILEKHQNSGWIQFKIEYDEDLKTNMLQGEIPEEEQEIIVTDGQSVWTDTFMRDGTECYLDGGNNLVDTVIAWQPLPDPWGKNEEAN